MKKCATGKKAAAQIALLLAGAVNAVLWRLARRGGDGAEQSHQTMSGVCGHWVRKFSGVSQTHVPLPGLDPGGRDALLTNLHLPNFLKGGLYQGAGKTVCVPGLNCYSCPAAVRGLSDRFLSGGGRLIEVQLFLLYNRLSHPVGCPCWGALYADFCAPSAGFRSCCIKFRRKSSPQKS